MKFTKQQLDEIIAIVDAEAVKYENSMTVKEALDALANGRTSLYKGYSSYRVKHIIERENNKYCTNAVAKCAMYMLGWHQKKDNRSMEIDADSLIKYDINLYMNSNQ